MLKLEKRLSQVAPGTELVVLATDPMAKVDIPLHCRQHGHACTVTVEDAVIRIAVVKSGPAATGGGEPSV